MNFLKEDPSLYINQKNSLLFSRNSGQNPLLPMRQQQQQQQQRPLLPMPMPAQQQRPLLTMPMPAQQQQPLLTMPMSRLRRQLQMQLPPPPPMQQSPPMQQPPPMQQEHQREHLQNKYPNFKFNYYLSLPDEKLYSKYIYNTHDVTILLQGVLNNEIDILKTIELYSLYGNIVLSVYDNEITKNTCNQILDSYPNVRIIYNNFETYETEFNTLIKSYNNKEKNIDNFYYQLKTTINGLNDIQTPYVLKSRVDHYYSDIDKFIYHGIASNKLVSSSLCVRGYFSPYLFHMSDQLFFGKTALIKQMCNLSQKMCFTPIMMNHVAESRLWKPYLKMLAHSEGINLDEKNHNFHINYIEFLNRKVTIFPINLHDNFKINLRGGNSNGSIYVKNLQNHPIYSSYYYFIYGVDKSNENITQQPQAGLLLSGLSAPYSN